MAFNLFGGSTTQGPTTQSGPPAWYQQAAQGYLNQAGQVASRPYQSYQGQQVANLNPLTQQAMQGYAGLMGNSGLGAGQQYVNNLLSGGGFNPFTQQVANTAIGDATRAFGDANTQLSRDAIRAGAMGSNTYQNQQNRNTEAFGRGLTQALGSIYNTGYENNANRQMNAVPMLTGLLGAQQGLYNQGANLGNYGQLYQQQLLDSQRQDWNNWWNYPTQQLNTYGTALGQTAGGVGQTQTTTQPNNPWSNLLGLGMLGYGLLG